MNHTELKAIDDLKAALIERKDEALARISHEMGSWWVARSEK